MTAAEDAAELYWSTFSGAPRYAVWAGGHWTPLAGRPTDETIVAALAGDGPPLSGFFLDDDSTARVFAIDVDADAWPLIEAVAERLLRAGVSCYIEHSRRGGHLWVIANAPVRAITGRYALMAAIEAARFNPAAKEIEVRPSSDRHSSEFAGGSLRLPWMRHPETGQRYGLLDPSTGQPLHPKIAGALSAIRPADGNALARLAERYVPPALPAVVRRPFLPDAGGISTVLSERFGIEAQPGHSIRCPFHPDHRPSMRIAPDDRRAWCHATACVANEDGRGITAWQAARLAGVS